MKIKIFMTLGIVGIIALLFLIDAQRFKFEIISPAVWKTKAEDASKDNAMKERFPDKNLLSKEKSPYLLQHADNPVHWYPWGDEAFAKAKAEDKPVFLSIGYSTCHWCHVMEHE